MADTRLPEVPPSSSVRTETGTIPTKRGLRLLAPGGRRRSAAPPPSPPAPRRWSCPRTPGGPAVPRRAGSSASATRRWGEMARLIDVRGASNGAGGSGSGLLLVPTAQGPGRPEAPATPSGPAPRRGRAATPARPATAPSLPAAGPGPTGDPGRLADDRLARRPGLRRPAPVRPNSGTGAGTGGQVEERRHHLGPGHPVDDRVVHLGHDGQASVLQALDHVELPQGPTAVERSRRQRRPPGRPARPGRPAPGRQTRRTW